MMLLPVQIASGSARNANSWVLQRTHSSAQPERCSAISVRTKTDSRTKSRSLETSRLLAATPSNPSAAATCSRSIGKRRAGQGGRAQGQHVQPLAAVGQRGRGRGRASRRRPGSNAPPAPAGPAACGCSRARSRRGAARPPPPGPAARRPAGASIRSRASRVQSLTSVATWSLRLRAVCSFRPTSPDPVDQGRLDVHVDVFALEDERELPRLDLRPDFRQTPHNLLAFVGSEQTDMGEHLGVRDRAPDVVLEEPTIKGDRFRELFDATVGFLAEPAAPGLVRHRNQLPNDESILLNPLANRRSV